MGMNHSEHISENMLNGFVAGSLQEVESEQVMAHLEGCDQCLARVDALWNSQPLGAAVSTIIELDDSRAKRMERKLAKQISRSNLAGTVVRMGTQGFISVTLGLLRPLINSRRADRGTQGVKDD